MAMDKVYKNHRRTHPQALTYIPTKALLDKTLPQLFRARKDEPLCENALSKWYDEQGDSIKNNWDVFKAAFVENWIPTGPMVTMLNQELTNINVNKYIKRKTGGAPFGYDDFLVPRYEADMARVYNTLAFLGVEKPSPQTRYANALLHFREAREAWAFLVGKGAHDWESLKEQLNNFKRMSLLMPQLPGQRSNKTSENTMEKLLNPQESGAASARGTTFHNAGAEDFNTVQTTWDGDSFHGT